MSFLDTLYDGADELLGSGIDYVDSLIPSGGSSSTPVPVSSPPIVPSTTTTKPKFTFGGILFWGVIIIGGIYVAKKVL